MEKRVDLEKATDYHNRNKIQLIDNHDIIDNSSVQFSHQSVTSEMNEPQAFPYQLSQNFWGCDSGEQ